jgi:hypothetical protein
MGEMTAADAARILAYDEGVAAWLQRGEIVDPPLHVPAEGEPPYPRGTAPAATLVESRRPPYPADGFWAAVQTERAWMMPCPCCVRAWIAILPVGEVYAPAAHLGCTADVPCEEGEIVAWFDWRRGLVPDVAPHEGIVAWCVRGVDRVCAELRQRPSAEALARAAFRAGQLAALGRLDLAKVRGALWLAAGRPDMAAFENAIRSNFAAGLARPARVPR